MSPRDGRRSKQSVPSPILPEIAQATLAVRWVVLCAVIALAGLGPSQRSTLPTLPAFGAAILYTLAFTLYGVRYPDRVGNAARWGIPFDVALVWFGMQVTSFPREFLFLGFPLAMVTGLLVGHIGATAVAIALALSQIPLMQQSIFAPDQWIGWGLLGLSLLAGGNAGAVASRHIATGTRFSHTLAAVGTAVASPAQDGTETGETILRAAAAYFRADSGALMLLDPHGGRLEIMTSHGLDASTQHLWPQVAESIAGWVAQGGRAVLLTPGTQFPLRLGTGPVRSSICVAVSVGGQAVGVLNLARSSTEGEFTKADLSAAELVADASTGYLLRAQDERRLSATLADLAEGHAKVSYALTRDPVVLWPALLDLARSLTSAQFAVLALEREDTSNVEIMAARGITGTAARDLLPALLAATTRGDIQVVGDGDTSRTSHVACIPLAVGTRIIGALGLGAPAEASCSRPLLLAIAAHIAAAVDTARTAHRVADIGAAEERRRLAREMHDGPAQTLANALLQLDLSAMTARAAPAQLGDELKGLRTLLEQVMGELRGFMTELRRTEGDDNRLFQGLAAMVKELERHHHLFITVVPLGDDAHLPPAVRHAILAIARQALANARAHARATTVTVRAEVTEALCTVSITDNGAGFDLEAFRGSLRARHHLGVSSMEERASLVGGRLEIESAPNRGTTVTVHVPLGVNDG